MSLETIVLKQYQQKVNQAVRRFEGFSMPAEGWLKTVRQALGMSGTQLAERLGVTKGSVSQAEAAELDGRVTLKKMQTMAEAMHCRFVYAIIPNKEVGLVIKEQAIKKAKARVKDASTQMALEAQSLSDEQLDAEIERIANDIIAAMPSDLWRDT